MKSHLKRISSQYIPHKILSEHHKMQLPFANANEFSSSFKIVFINATLFCALLDWLANFPPTNNFVQDHQTLYISEF
jgi:hypothetical protein